MTWLDWFQIKWQAFKAYWRRLKRPSTNQTRWSRHHSEDTQDN